MKNPIIGERLKFYRKKNHLSVEQVCEILSEVQPVAKKTVYGWESGHTQPDVDTVLRLCCLYHIDNILEIFEYETSKKALFNLTNHEKDLIISYRNHPDMQKAVQRLLDIEFNNE